MTESKEKPRVQRYLALSGIVLGGVGILLATTAPVFGPMLGAWLAG